MAKQAEPEFGPKLNDLKLVEALNWYHVNRNDLDARRFLYEYAKVNIDSKLTINDISQWDYLTCDGWIARLLSKDAELPSVTQELKFQKLLQTYMNEVEDVEITPTKNKPKPKKQKIEMGILGELENQVDVFIAGGCDNGFDPKRFLSAHNVSRKDCTNIKRWAKNNRKHMEEVIAPNPDKQLKEAYSNFSKPQLKRLHKFYDTLYVTAYRYTKIKTKTKPRTKKGSVTQSTLEAHISKL